MVRRLLDEASFTEAACAIGETFRNAGGWQRAAAEILAWRPS
jgi:hypothetical protein